MSLINLVGAIFSKGCRQNLNGYLGKCLVIDFCDATLKTIAVTVSALFPPAILAVLGIHCIEASFGRDMNMKWLSNGHLNAYYHVKAVRKFHYDSLLTLQMGLNTWFISDLLNDISTDITYVDYWSNFSPHVKSVIQRRFFDIALRTTMGKSADVSAIDVLKASFFYKDRAWLTEITGVQHYRWQFLPRYSDSDPLQAKF